MQLSEYTQALAYDAAFWLAGVKNPDYPIAQLGGLALEVGSKLRCCAIVALVVRADSDVFCHDLIRAGLAWESYLTRCTRERARDDHHFASGRVAPVLDALAAGDFALVERIGALAPTEFRRGHEYEDDFCYGQALRLLVRDNAQARDVEAFLARMEAFLDGAPNARLDVCRALNLRDAAAFEVAFTALLDAREAEIEAAKQRGQLEEPHVIAERRVYCEGLALLRLADRRSVPTLADYRFCPSLARRPMRKPFPGE